MNEEEAKKILEYIKQMDEAKDKDEVEGWLVLLETYVMEHKGNQG